MFIKIQTMYNGVIETDKDNIVLSKTTKTYSGYDHAGYGEYDKIVYYLDYKNQDEGVLKIYGKQCKIEISEEVYAELIKDFPELKINTYCPKFSFRENMPSIIHLTIDVLGLILTASLLYYSYKILA